MAQPIELNMDLHVFDVFARNQEIADDQAAQMFGVQVVKATKTAGAAARLFNLSADAKAATSINNDVRNHLIAALKGQFGVNSFDDLPAAVRAAFKGTHAFSEKGDLGLVNDKVTSGRPLTKRRISAIIEATRECLVENNSLSATTKADKIVIERQQHASEFAQTVTDSLFEQGVFLDSEKSRARVKERVQDYVANFFVGYNVKKGMPDNLFNIVNSFAANQLQSLGVIAKVKRAESDERDWVLVAFSKAIDVYNQAHPKSAYVEKMLP